MKIIDFVEKVFFILFSSLIIFSCSDSRNIVEEDNSYTTIKSIIGNIESDTVWSVELEKDRLSEKVGIEPEYIPEGSYLTKDNSKILKNYKCAVYPSFSDFGSLDISKAELKYINTADRFCENLSNGEEEKIYSSFNNNYKFNFVFFISALKTGWKEYFGSDFPVPELKNEEVKNQESKKES